MYFVFEHPAGADIWNLPCARKLESLIGMRYAEFDIGAFGSTAEVEGKQWALSKPMRVYTNSPAIDGMLSHGRNKLPGHLPTMDGRFERRKNRPKELMDAILEGLRIEGL